MLGIITVISALSVAELPEIAQQDIEYAREMCRMMGRHFDFDTEYLETADINFDAQADYVLDGRGFTCAGMENSLYRSKAGTPFYVYISTSKETWEKALSTYIREYFLHPPKLDSQSLDVWLRGEFGYQTNRLRYQWRQGKFEVIEQEHGAEVPRNLWKQFD